jgi:hypothetical protein
MNRGIGIIGNADVPVTMCAIMKDDLYGSVNMPAGIKRERFRL